MVVEETTFSIVLQEVDALPAEPRVIHTTALDLVAKEFSSSEDRALRVSRVLVLTVLLLLLGLLSLPLSRWLDTGFLPLLTPVSDHLLTHLTTDFCRIEAWRTYGSLSGTMIRDTLIGGLMPPEK